MFDIGFAELLIIGVVALLVIGPERLPEAVRTASAWLNRIRRGFNDIKQEVQQELHNDSVMRELRETGDNLRRETSALRSDLRKPLDQLTGDILPRNASNREAVAGEAAATDDAESGGAAGAASTTAEKAAEENPAGADSAEPKRDD